MEMKEPRHISVRFSLYQWIYELTSLRNCSTAVAFKFRWKNSSVFNQPKEPSHATLPNEQPLPDIERTRFALPILDRQPRQR